MNYRAIIQVAARWTNARNVRLNSSSSTSATAISRAVSRPWSTSSLGACSRPSSTPPLPVPHRYALDAKGRVMKRYRDRDVMTPQRPSSSPSTTPSASSNPVSPSTSSTPSPTPSATSTPPTRSTMPATHCSAPSGAPGALRPDPPSHPRSPLPRRHACTPHPT